MNQQSSTGSNPWADIVGPCYTASSLARALDWTEAAVIEAADSFTLLTLTTDDEVELYPAFRSRTASRRKGWRRCSAC